MSILLNIIQVLSSRIGKLFRMFSLFYFPRSHAARRKERLKSIESNHLP